jgi:aspartate racemase
MKNKKIIGVVGGVGPVAGLDLVDKIFNQTRAKCDQEHLSVLLLSFSQDIADRTAFILGETNVNPAHAIFRIIQKLESIGASVIGIPCNGVFAPQIFDVILEELKQTNSRVKLIHIVDEVAKFIRGNCPEINNVGVLSTTGTYKARVYVNILESNGIRVVLPDENVQESVHSAISDPMFGIKAQSNPVTDAAKQRIFEAINHLRKKNAEAIVLGCTDLPLAVTEKTIENILIIDSTLILARALIKEVNPDKLKPMHYQGS